MFVSKYTRNGMGHSLRLNTDKMSLPFTWDHFTWLSSTSTILNLNLSPFILRVWTWKRKCYQVLYLRVVPIPVGRVVSDPTRSSLRRPWDLGQVKGDPRVFILGGKKGRRLSTRCSDFHSLPYPTCSLETFYHCVCVCVLGWLSGHHLLGLCPSERSFGKYRYYDCSMRCGPYSKWSDQTQNQGRCQWYLPHGPCVIFVLLLITWSDCE